MQLTRKKFLIAAVMLVAPLYVSSASATDWDALDAEYEQCVARYVQDGFGNPDQAAAWCYPRIYGGEESGGGTPDPYPLPVPGTPCYGSCGFN